MPREQSDGVVCTGCGEWFSNEEFITHAPTCDALLNRKPTQTEIEEMFCADKSRQRLIQVDPKTGKPKSKK